MDCLTENVFKDKAFDVFVYLKALCVLFTARSVVQTMYHFIQTSKKGAHELQKKFFLFRCLLFSQNLSSTYLLPPILPHFPPTKAPNQISTVVHLIRNLKFYVTWLYGDTSLMSLA